MGHVPCWRQVVRAHVSHMHMWPQAYSTQLIVSRMQTTHSSGVFSELSSSLFGVSLLLVAAAGAAFDELATDAEAAGTAEVVAEAVLPNSKRWKSSKAWNTVLNQVDVQGSYSKPAG